MFQSLNLPKIFICNFIVRSLVPGKQDGHLKCGNVQIEFSTAGRKSYRSIAHMVIPTINSQIFKTQSTSVIFIGQLNKIPKLTIATFSLNASFYRIPQLQVCNLPIQRVN